MVLWETRPALRSAELYRALYALSKEWKKPPLLASAVVLNAFKEEFELARPPPAIAHLLFGCLAPIGRLAGHGRFLSR